MVDVGPDEFARLVAEAIDDVPEPFAGALDEVAVVVEERSSPDDPDLYGLYIGVPLVDGSPFSGTLPPRIAVYRRPLADHCRDRSELIEQVRITVLHELGHHLGLDEDRLDELGYA